MLLAACASPTEKSETESTFQHLVELTDFAEVERDADPFITELDAAPACAGPGFVVEEQWLEIDTALCNWVTLSAPARFTVERGQQLRITVSHFDLNAPSPSEGEARLSFGACNAWLELVPIPSPAAVYAEAFASPCEVAAGSNVYFHLHNHGQNNWQLQELSVRR